MADKMMKNYKISGSGVLDINGDTIIICVEDKGEFNLANVLSDLDGYSIKFSFSYEEDYLDEPIVDEDTGEVI